jgi:hypothetical protein
MDNEDFARSKNARETREAPSSQEKNMNIIRETFSGTKSKVQLFNWDGVLEKKTFLLLFSSLCLGG